MTAALTPALALDYIHNLSNDVRAGVVLDSTGTLLAGPEPLAAPARALLESAPGATEIEGTIADGKAFAARTDTHAIVIATGPFALARLTRHDLRTAVSALGGETPPNPRLATAPEPATRTLIKAAQDPFRRNSAV
ncbi:MAG TPA: hypothetical protein VFZ00_24730 [Solirubrobacter sp.]|nr:hypothetical protein [Solirubrobacter sp.]